MRCVLHNIPGIDVEHLRINKCYRIDGSYKTTGSHHILCSFNWHYDVQCILKNRKLLPKGIFVTEDLPEEWIDCRKILKPISNAAKWVERLKSSTKLVKDRLIIDDYSFTVAPENNPSGRLCSKSIKETEPDKNRPTKSTQSGRKLE